MRSRVDSTAATGRGPPDPRGPLSPPRHRDALRTLRGRLDPAAPLPDPGLERLPHPGDRLRSPDRTGDPPDALRAARTRTRWKRSRCRVDHLAGAVTPTRRSPAASSWRWSTARCRGARRGAHAVTATPARAAPTAASTRSCCRCRRSSGAGTTRAGSPTASRRLRADASAAASTARASSSGSGSNARTPTIRRRRSAIRCSGSSRSSTSPSARASSSHRWTVSLAPIRWSGPRRSSVATPVAPRSAWTPTAPTTSRLRMRYISRPATPSRTRTATTRRSSTSSLTRPAIRAGSPARATRQLPRLARSSTPRRSWWRSSRRRSLAAKPESTPHASSSPRHTSAHGWRRCRGTAVLRSSPRRRRSARGGVIGRENRERGGTGRPLPGHIPSRHR